MRYTACSHSAVAVHTPSILMGHRLAMIDSWGYRSSGDHTAVGIGRIAASRRNPAELTLDSVVVSRTSYRGRIRVCCRSQPQLAAGAKPAGFVGERSLLRIHRIPHSPERERERIPCSQKSCLHARRHRLSVMAPGTSRVHLREKNQNWVVLEHRRVRDRLYSVCPFHDSRALPSLVSSCSMRRPSSASQVANLRLRAC